MFWVDPVVQELITIRLRYCANKQRILLCGIQRTARNPFFGGGNLTIMEE